MSKPLPSGIIARTTSYNIDPSRVIKAEGWNTRFDMGDIKSLSESIRTELQRDPSSGGLLNAVRVRRITGNPDADFQIVDGERRMTAVWALLESGVQFPEGIAATLVDKKQDDVTSLIQMYTANTGKPFLPLEEAAAFKRMKDSGMKIAEISKAVGRTDVHIIETMGLLEADGDLQASLAAGQVGATIAKIISTTAKGDKALQKDLLADAKNAKGTGAAAKAAKARLLKKLQDKKEARAAAKGKTLKMRALSDQQLTEMGAKLAKVLEVKAKEAFPIAPPKTLEDMQKQVAKDEKMTAAFTLGAMMALRAAAGMKVELDI
jgi:ParB-like chromosome segregation protein Spo0J